MINIYTHYKYKYAFKRSHTFRITKIAEDGEKILMDVSPVVFLQFRDALKMNSGLTGCITHHLGSLCEKRYFYYCDYGNINDFNVIKLERKKKTPKKKNPEKNPKKTQNQTQMQPNYFQFQIQTASQQRNHPKSPPSVDSGCDISKGWRGRLCSGRWRMELGM